MFKPTSVKEGTNALWRKVLKGDMEIHNAVRMLGDLCQAEVIKMGDQRRCSVSVLCC
ncbi:MAG: hypothetical protein QXU47_03720 [Candidatus Bathyarchaeia archaeon]